MRVLVLSDIHANRAALEAIQEEYDVCLFLGDVVDYALEPAPCIEWVRQRATYSVRGNHDHGVAQKVFLQGVGGYRYLTGVTRPLTVERITEGQRRWLGALPTSRMLTLNGKRYLLVHATPRDPMDEYAPPDVDFWTRKLEGISADYVCVGHTHVQFILQVGNTTVLNPGSVGLPRDGDPRAAYALITDDGPVLKRAEYPIEETVASVEAADMPDLAKQMLTEILRNGRLERKGANGRPGEVNGAVDTQTG
jgi:putative phosphoesterase